MLIPLSATWGVGEHVGESPTVYPPWASPTAAKLLSASVVVQHYGQKPARSRQELHGALSNTRSTATTFLGTSSKPVSDQRSSLTLCGSWTRNLPFLFFFCCYFFFFYNAWIMTRNTMATRPVCYSSAQRVKLNLSYTNPALFCFMAYSLRMVMWRV